MCGIFAAFVKNEAYDMAQLLDINASRGRDSWGTMEIGYSGHIVHKQTTGYVHDRRWSVLPYTTLLGNMRAEPTTEYVKEKTRADVQPYVVGKHAIVHNGTIANDKALVKQHAFEPETAIDSWVIAALVDKHQGNLLRAVKELIGSYSIASVSLDDPDTIQFATNYKPLYYHDSEKVRALSSVPIDSMDYMIPPYSYGTITRSSGLVLDSLRPTAVERRKALVVCSGGLDSTVAAAALRRQGYDITLLHYSYGARANDPEAVAVRNVAQRLKAPVINVTTPIFKDVIGGSRLTETKSEIAGGVEGAEYAHEWVPARNLIMLSIALGIAESRGFDFLATGANLEEAGAYPDNEPQFIKSFAALIPFAVADGKHIELLTPVGNLMKHEIVKLGIEVDAPFDVTFSCYNAKAVPFSASAPLGYAHCGQCGPCFMRRTAFTINGAVDPVFACEQVPDAV